MELSLSTDYHPTDPIRRCQELESVITMFTGPQDVLSMQAYDGRVAQAIVEYTGRRAGAVTYLGPSGRTYRFGAGPAPRKLAHPGDGGPHLTGPHEQGHSGEFLPAPARGARARDRPRPRQRPAANHRPRGHLLLRLRTGGAIQRHRCRPRHS